MKIEHEKKVDILLAALSERYESLHKIRERVQTIGIWTLGLLLGAASYLVQSNVVLTCFEKVFVLFGLSAGFYVLRFIYLVDLKKGFLGQQIAMVRIEKALELFTPGAFDETDDPIYPKKWLHSGTNNGDGKFFDTTYILLYVGIIFLALSIIFNGFTLRQHEAHHHGHAKWIEYTR